MTGARLMGWGPVLTREEPSRTVEALVRAEASTAAPGESLAVAAARMRRTGVDALVVLDGVRLVGVVSGRDILRAVADGLSTDMTPVGDYMRPAPVQIEPAADVTAAIEQMTELRVSHLPVTSGGRVVGLISARDLWAERHGPPELLCEEPW